MKTAFKVLGGLLAVTVGVIVANAVAYRVLSERVDTDTAA